MTLARPTVPEKCSREWLLSAPALMAEDVSCSKSSLQYCARGPQIKAQGALPSQDNTTKE